MVKKEKVNIYLVFCLIHLYNVCLTGHGLHQVEEISRSLWNQIWPGLTLGPDEWQGNKTKYLGWDKNFINSQKIFSNTENYRRTQDNIDETMIFYDLLKQIFKKQILGFRLSADVSTLDLYWKVFVTV